VRADGGVQLPHVRDEDTDLRPAVEKEGELFRQVPADGIAAPGVGGQQRDPHVLPP
jgi:hypothetical protein